MIGERTDSSIILGASMDVKPADIFADDAWLKDGGLKREQILRFLTDIHYEPSWRQASDIDVDYYDGKQLDAEVLKLFKKRGIPPLIINMIQPTVNAVLGLEAKTRSDAEVTFEDEASEQVAVALNKKMNDAEREAYIDRACSEAYGSQVKAGLGWVEVQDNPHPLQYKYRVKPVHRREIWWDWRDADHSLDNARWLVRKKWFDDDVLEKLLPDYQQYIGSRMSLDGFMAVAQHLNNATGLDSSNEIERAVTMEQAEWRDADRRRSILYEVWYRVWQESFVARLPNDRVIEIDPENEQHMQMVVNGQCKPMKALWPKMRQSFWMGPYRFLDRWSPLPHQGFPYVPFWGFREDLSTMPYGLIRAMRSPQDEINARRSKMMALMSARRVQVDSDALDLTHNSHQQVANQASSHDHYIILDPQRKNGQFGLKIDNNLDLSAPQLEVLREAKAEIHQTSGVFNEQVGNAPASRSGYAINSLIEQGNTTLAEINDNYRYGRRLVFSRLLDHIKRDSCHEHCVTVGDGKAKKQIWLNQKAPDSAAILNDVAMSTARVTLQEVPSSQSYRQQQFMMLSEMTKALPPEVQAFVVPFVLEASDVPERKKMAMLIRQKLGIPEPGTEDQQPPPLPPEVQNELVQGREMVQQQQAVIQDLSTKLQTAVNAMTLENQKHTNRMAELDATARMKQTDFNNQQAGKVALANANADAGASGQAGQGIDDQGANDVDAEALAVLKQLAAKVDALEKAQGPKRSIVKDRGDGTYEVLTVPVQQQAGIPQQPAAQPGAPA